MAGSLILQWQIAQGCSKTIVEFAQYLGVSRDALYKWMNGQRVPDHASVAQLADKLGPDVYDALSLPRPNERLLRIKKVWEDLPEDEQESFTAAIERAVTGSGRT